MVDLAKFAEPEELIGELWHRLIGEVDSEPSFPEAAVTLEQMQKRLGVLFRGLGGGAGVEVKPIPAQSSDYRQRFLARIGHGSNAVTCARFDGDNLFMPESIDLLPSRQANENIYKWLVAWAAVAGDRAPRITGDQLRDDIAFIRFAAELSREICQEYPGMKAIYNHLRQEFLAMRLKKQLPESEAVIEAAICAVLAAEQSLQAETSFEKLLSDLEEKLDNTHAGAKYKTFFPLVIWGEIAPRKLSGPLRREDAEVGENDGGEEEDSKTRKAKREKSDQVERNDSFLLHRFEAILSWSEMMNINRGVDDDEEDSAKKAAEDQEEFGLGNISKKAATKLKFDLDLAPEDVEHERISARHTYSEWDYRKHAYYKDHCRVLAAVAPSLENGVEWQPDKAARRRIRAVKRQFEALRPRRERVYRQIDGDEIDMDALIRARCDLSASGEGSNRVFSSMRIGARDLAVGVLIDISRSSESWIEHRQVIDISKEALMALALGLAACGDDNAIFSFSSLRRDRVFVSTVKSFTESLGPQVFSRIGALKPGFYTRLGAAIRHVSGELAKTGNQKKLLLVLSDGKPNDLDHYEGRYGVEDTRKAVLEARQAGMAVFGITIDKKAQSYFPHIFGQNAFAIAGHPNDLTRALPLMYRQLVG